MNTFITPVEFKLQDMFTFGVEHNKFGDGYSLSLKLNEETKQKIEDLVSSYETKNPIYGSDILYLKFGAITEKQQTHLLNQGRCYIHINFNVIGVYKNTKSGIRYLVFRVVGLGRSEKQEDEERPPQDLEFDLMM